MAKVLQLQFKTAGGANCSLSIDTPKDNLTTAEVYQVMNTILSNNVFEIEGSPLSEIVGARYVERNVTELKA
ncbi:DUF2922 domain-containing protein [Rummeliibacillus sp. TYF005]|uniref:DUF2922 domain-containing protein n=1 Tax=Rummeliibacillus sp. TYF005 TaxID=2058214 RepID=UPI000F521662|nr:DUF2922 domain-containing protein [Rummeliibacillus sp. TYF005]RPJ97440.1 DUF2922 domain-containing protein [Rummeliibacillus sp. TYF005]